MDFDVRRKDLVDALTFLIRFTEKRSIIPILRHVLIDASEDGEINICATDVECRAEFSLKAAVIGKGRICLDVILLQRIIKSVPSQERVTIRDADREEWVEIKFGAHCVTMPGLSSSDFPTGPDFNDKELIPLFTLGGDQLKQLCTLIIPSISEEESRFQLSSALIKISEDNKVELASTDGYRLNWATIDTATLGASSFLVRRAVFSALSKSSSNLMEGQRFMIGSTSNHILMKSSQIRVSSLRDNGKFPEFERIIPDKSKRVSKFQISKRTIWEAISLSMVISATMRSRAAKIECSNDGQLVMSAGHSYTACVNSEIEKLNIDTLWSFGIDASYLKDAVRLSSIVGDGGFEVSFGSKEIGSCIIIFEPTGAKMKFVQAVMPVLLDF